MTIERYGLVRSPGRPSMSLCIARGEWVTVCLTAQERPAGIISQTRQIFALLDDFLARAGTDKSRLLTAQVWLRDIDDYDAMNAVWNGWIDHGNPPVRSCMRADMARPDTLIEIRITAAR